MELSVCPVEKVNVAFDGIELIDNSGAITVAWEVLAKEYEAGAIHEST